MRETRLVKAAGFAGCILIFAALGAARAEGASCPDAAAGPAGPALPASICNDAGARLKFLRGALRETQATERRWSNSWGLGWAGLTVLQLAASPLIPKDDHKRDDLYVGAAGSAVGLLPTLIVRPRSLAYVDLAAQTDNSCDTLAATETALENAAADERLRNGWISRIGGALFSTGLGLYLGLHYHHWVSAGFTLGFGLISTEAMIRTGTNRAIEASERYRAGDLSQRDRTDDFNAGTLHVSLLLEPDAAGLGFSLAI